MSSWADSDPSAETVLASGSIDAVDELSAIRSTIREALPPDVDADAVELIATELCTNGLEHGNPPVTWSLRMRGPDVIVEVADTSPVLPVVRDPEPTAPHGRGMRLVDALATSWWVRNGSSDKTVVACLSRG